MPAVGVGEDPLLWEGHDLQLHPPFISSRTSSIAFRATRLGSEHPMSPHELDAVGNLPFQCLDGALFHILMGQQPLRLGPTLDPLEQGAGEVPTRLASRLGVSR